MDRTHENMTKYAAFVAGRCKTKQLRPFHKSAVARLIEHSSRLVEDQDKLTTRFIRIENVGEQYSPLPSSTLRPQPIPINAKIILVGSPDLLRTLQAVDEDFQRYFKVTADFDTLMERTRENMTKYAAFVAGQCKANELRPFHKSAVARLIEHSGRLVEDQGKLTTRFMDVSPMGTLS